MWFCFIFFLTSVFCPSFYLRHTHKHTLINFLYPCCWGNTLLFKDFYPHTENIQKTCYTPFSPSLVSWVLHVLYVVTLTPASACWCHNTSELFDTFYSGASGSCELFFKSSHHESMMNLLRLSDDKLCLKIGTKTNVKACLRLSLTVQNCYFNNKAL